MLIEFTVENFRSFREAQTLRMDAAYGTDEHPENLIPVGHVPGMKGVNLLKVAAIYGPNASGKSNVFRAMAFLGGFVADSASDRNQGDPTDAEPFLLDSEFSAGPSRFEIRFVCEGVQYLYALAVDGYRVHEESLDTFPEKRQRKVFHRVTDISGASSIYVGSNYDSEIDAALRKRARPNASFLSVAAQFNCSPLMGVYSWFANTFRAVDMSFRGTGFTHKFTSSLCESYPEARDQVRELLRLADLGINDFSIQWQKVSPEQLPLFEHLKSSAQEKIIRSIQKDFEARVELSHRSDNHEGVSFPLHRESAGTERFFVLIGPLIETLLRGYTVIIDEFDTSMHPQLVIALLDWFRNFEGGTPGAQLIFTTHDTSLMTLAKMRRDQFWFTEKHGDGATRLYPLTDYKPRRGESLSKGYLSGRYGAIPMVDDLPLVGKKRE